VSCAGLCRGGPCLVWPAASILGSVGSIGPSLGAGPGWDSERPQCVRQAGFPGDRALASVAAARSAPPSEGFFSGPPLASARLRQPTRTLPTRALGAKAPPRCLCWLAAGDPSRASSSLRLFRICQWTAQLLMVASAPSQGLSCAMCLATGHVAVVHNAGRKQPGWMRS
jgi:hypothetical protein